MKYELPSYSIEEIANNGYSTLGVKVLGFWSNPISITISRSERYGSHIEWKASVSHSSGGRDNEIVCDLEAEENMGYAMIAAVALAREILTHKDELESLFIEQEKIRVAEHEAIQSANLEKIAADHALTPTEAKNLVKEFLSLEGAGVKIQVYLRGQDFSTAIYHSGTGRTILRNKVISRTALIEYITGKSVRTRIVPV